MELNEIKKALYKQSPDAIFQHATKDGLLYHVYLMDDKQLDIWHPKETKEITLIQFIVPFNEIGDVKWGAKMEAKLLIRYII